MKKLFLVIALLGIIGVSCQKDGDQREVQYLVTGLQDEYELVYLNAEGKSVSSKVDPASPVERMVQTFKMDQGSPIYLYIKFTDDISSVPSFNMGILIDGKYQYQAKYYDRSFGDTLFEVKRAGIVPID
jgi:hypothetical protein